MKPWTTTLAIVFLLFHSPAFSKPIENAETIQTSLTTGIDSEIVSGLDPKWHEGPSPFEKQSNGFALKIGNGNQGSVLFPILLDSRNPIVIGIGKNQVQQFLASEGTYKAQLVGRYLVYVGTKNSILYRYDADKRSLREFVYLKDSSVLTKNGDIIQWRFEGADLKLLDNGSVALTQTINIKNKVRKVSSNHMAERISRFLAKRCGTPEQPGTQTWTLFTIPKPEYIDGHGKILTQGIQYKVADGKLTLHLDSKSPLAFPLWADPSFQFLASQEVDLILPTGNFAFGASIASAGDFNGDGIDDIIIGDRSGLNSQNESSGNAYIFFGYQPSASPETINSTDDADIIIMGTDWGDEFGYSAASGGDFNGDGLDDVIIGARWDDNNGNASGRAFIFYGRNPNGQLILQADVDADIILDSRNPQGWLGFSVASAGDFNNDGLDDVIVGEPHDYSNGRSQNGNASIYFGRQSSVQLILDSNTDADVIIEGFNNSDHVGESLASIGDFNGDGFEDVVLGINNQAFIIFGRQVSSQLVLNVNPEANISIRGQFFDDRFGTSVSSAGDFNGDGWDDVIIGAPDTDHYGTSSGSAYIFFGQSPTGNLIFNAEVDADVILHGQNVQDRFGTSLASIGDLNQDGFDDVIVGAPGADTANSPSIFEGSVNFFYGREPSSQVTLLAPADAQFTYIGWDNGGFSTSLGAGDFNGLGRTDVLVNTTTKRVYLFFQEDSTPPELTMNGDTLTLWEVGTLYVDPGATAIDVIDGDMTFNIIVGGLPINTDNLGTYIVTYDVTDSSGNTAHAERTVNVVDSPPVINIQGFSIAIVEVGLPYIDAGATAIDLVDGDLTANIVVGGLPVDTNILGQHIVTYDVTDSFGNTTHAERIVDVVQVAPPIITILGNNPEDIEGGSVYVDAGATAVDVVDGDLTNSIVVGGLPLDTSTLGAKTVTYDIVSSRGSPAHAERTVNVIDTTPPVVTAPPDLGPIEATNRYTSVNIGTATVTDNIAVISIINDAPIAFPLGTTVVTWTATDTSGNITTATQNITVQDTTPPWNIPPPDKLVDATGILTTVNIGNTNASDIVELLSVTNDAPAQFPLGNTVVTWTATDTSGNVTIAKQNVKVQHHHQPVAQIDGQSENDFLGYSVASAGDFNGDGIEDIIVGAYGDNNYNGSGSSGSAFIFFGSNSTTTFNLKNSSDADIVLDGQDFGDQFGFSVASAGDFNGDGLGDVIVGAPRDDNNGENDSGSAFIFLGRNPTSQLILQAGSDAEVVLDGQNTIDLFGHSVASAGDFNGDGYSDVIVGAPDDFNVFQKSPGDAFIFFGRNPNSQLRLRAGVDADIILNGKNLEDRFGTSVSSAGDFNGDGLDDVIVGAKHDDNNGERDSGSAFIFFGQNPADQLALEADADANIILDGQDGGDWFGFSVSSAGDFNGDGVGDVIVGAPLDDNPVENSTQWTSGSTFIFFGRNPAGQIVLRADADANVKVNSQSSGDQFGYSVASAGDFDGDGLDDVIVGAIFDGNNGIHSSGSASIFSGRNPSSQEILSADKDSYVVVNGQSTFDYFGLSVAPIKDFNGDGLDDVLVGAYLDDNNGKSGSGSVFIYPGKNPSAPNIIILGGSHIVVEVGAPYVDAGAIALDDADGDISDSIVVSGLPIDTNLPGTYVVSYDVTDSSGNSNHAERRITVPDLIPPVVTAPADVTTEATGTTTPVSIGTAIATDNVAVVSITNNAPTTFPLGTTVVTWTATDTSGNTGTAAQNVTVQDTTSPVLTILGGNPVSVNQGVSYTDTGATAMDSVDGDLTTSIVVGGLPIDTTILGTYTVTYDVTDSAGNAAHAERTVNVVSPLPPGPQNDVVANLPGSGVSVLLNDNSSSVVLHADTAEVIATADVDNDGVDDVIVSFPTGTGPDGTGGTYISRNQDPLTLLDSKTAERIAVGNFDGIDGDDLFLDFGADGLWSYMNDTTLSLFDTSSTVAMTSGDVDNNNQDDLVYSIDGQGTFIYQNFTAPSVTLDSSAAEMLVTGDIDGNGEDDIAAGFASGSGPSGTGGLFIARNQGALTLLTTGQVQQATSGDFDGTGQDDLALDFGGATGLVIYLNDASAMFLTTMSPTAMTSGDVDSSGQDDLIVSFDGFGTAVFKDLTTVEIWNLAVAQDIATGNVNGN